MIIENEFCVCLLTDLSETFGESTLEVLQNSVKALYTIVDGCGQATFNIQLHRNWQCHFLRLKG